MIRIDNLVMECKVEVEGGERERGRERNGRREGKRNEKNEGYKMGDRSEYEYMKK